MKKISILTLGLVLVGANVQAGALELARDEVNAKLAAVRESCDGIKSNLDTIFGLSVGTAASSGVGTLAAGGALAAGLVKNKVDEELEDLSNLESYELYQKIQGIEQKYKTRKKELETKSKTLGNVRTGLMAGTTVTSGVSTGLSIGATVTAAKLAEKMEKCNADLKALKVAEAKLEAEEETNVEVREVLAVCTGYDLENIKTLKNLALANSIVSGVGTVTGGAGTVTSIMANSEKVRGDDSENGKKKEKGLNTASNILAGVTMGTSGASTALSAIQILKAKKDSEMAEKCEAALK